MIRDHITVRDLLWFKTGGVADYFSICHKPNEIVEAITTAQEQKMAYRVVGKGSKSLFSDSGFPGLLIQNQTDGMVFVHDRSQVIVDSGVTLETLIHRAASLGYGGLEHFYGLPGTVGGALVNNSGIADYTLGQYLRSATILVAENGKSVAARRVSRDWFKFSPHSSYIRDESVTDRIKNLPIILSATFQLSRMNHEACLQRIRQSAQEIEAGSVSQPKSLRVFSNLGVKKTTQKKIHSTSSEPLIVVSRQQIKRWRAGDVALSEKSPNYLINSNIGTSRDAALVISQVKNDLTDDNNSVSLVVNFIGLWEENELP